MDKKLSKMLVFWTNQLYKGNTFYTLSLICEYFNISQVEVCKEISRQGLKREDFPKLAEYIKDDILESVYRCYGETVYKRVKSPLDYYISHIKD